MKNGDRFELIQPITTDEGREFEAGTTGWIVDVQGGGSGYVIAEAAQIGPCNA